MGAEWGIGAAVLAVALVSLRLAPRLTVGASLALLASLQLGIFSPSSPQLGERLDRARAAFTQWTAETQQAAGCSQSRLLVLGSGDEPLAEQVERACPGR